MTTTEVSPQILKDIALVNSFVDEEKTGKKFYFQGPRMMLTFKTHINKSEFKLFIENDIGYKPKFIEIAHENGDDDPYMPYKHSHVLIDFGKRFQTHDCRRFDWGEDPDRPGEKIHCMIQKIAFTKHWMNSLRYIAKEDPENAYLLTPNVLPEAYIAELMECSDAKDILEKFFEVDEHGRPNWLTVKTIMDIKAKLAPVNNVKGCEIDELDHPWQEKLLKMISKKSNGRRIIWYYDQKGGIGKSTLTKSLVTQEPEHFLEIPISKIANVAEWVTSAMLGGWKGTGMIVDIARSQIDKSVTGWEHNANIYHILENAVDGKIFKEKWGSQMKYWNPGHIIVFANIRPNLPAMSADRWKVIEINADDPKQCLQNPIGSRVVTADAFNIWGKVLDKRAKKVDLVAALPAPETDQSICYDDVPPEL